MNRTRHNIGTSTLDSRYTKLDRYGLMIEKHLEELHSKIETDMGLKVAILGDSTQAGIGASGRNVYAEQSNKNIPVGMENLPLNMIFNSPYLLTFDETVKASLAPETTGLLGATKWRRLEFIVSTSPNVTYTYNHRDVKRNTLTIVYLKRKSDAAAIFDVVCDGVTTSVDTYKSDVTFGSVGAIAQVGFDYATQEITIPTTSSTFSFTINNVRVIDRGSGVAADGTAGIIGFYYGKAIDFRNFAVSSMTLLDNSTANQSRGVTTSGQLQKAYDFGANVFILGWGTNDSKSGVSTVAAYTTDLTTRISEIRAQSPGAIIILNSCPIGEAGSIYENNYLYFDAMRQVAINTDCSFFDTENLFKDFTRATVVADQVHPSITGYNVIGESISKIFGFKNRNDYINESFENTLINQQVNTNSTPTFNGIQFDTTPTTITNAEGLLKWNSTDGTLDLGMDSGNITLQIGQEMFVKVRNPSGGSTILNGQAVYISGRTGVFPDVALARGDTDLTSCVIGLATQDIPSPGYGYITTFGYVRGIKTDYTGTGNWGTTWSEGDTLYLSKTVAGQVTNVEPTVPNHSDVIGSVGVVSPTQGSILVNIQKHKTLEELSDVNGTPLTTTGQFPVWNQTTGYFDFDKNIITEYVPYTGANKDVDLGLNDLACAGLAVGSVYTAAAVDGIIDVARETASTNIILTLARLRQRSSGTPTIGLGSAFSHRAENSAGQDANCGYFAGRLRNVTDGSEIGDMVIAPDWQDSQPAMGIGFSRIFGVRANDVNSVTAYLPHDDSKLVFGTGEDASIQYNGTDLVVNPKVVGSGIVSISGTLKTDDYLYQKGTFAEIYVSDASAVQSIPTGTTYTKLTCFTTNGESSNCTPDATNDKITITKAGRYRVNGTFSANDGLSGATFRFALFYDGTEISKIHTARKFAAGSDVGAFSFTGILNSAANKDIDVRARHDSGGSVDVTVQYANLNIEYIGE